MKKVLLPILGVAVFIIAVGLLTKNTQKWRGVLEEKKEIKVGSTTILVEIADDDEERRNGLGGRTDLPEGIGMLFVMPSQNSNPGFWMKDMVIPIDIIWVNDGKIVKIDKNVQPPPPGTPDSEITVYRLDTPVDYVLEVTGGYSDKKGFKEGDLSEINI